ncbi:exopolysaccharide production protein [Paraglaciecola sp. T6c]|uniref:O-antigen ligase family protein n=1 Tax=Pseudoalteromonas atlantica (strain T6c / ATCC BAA-1087) TaxID=3042615 RepID=UPI00005C6A5D|nr:O-antigen ligase family protein [Paraglaciecola sp. T6c]ABG39617.1 exopolysaccharide production protein [Paraglaciecola sp. T6c]
MKITLDTLKRAYLFTTVFYYFGFLSFTSRLLAGGRADDLMSANASGNAAKQIVGILLLLTGIYLLLKVDKKLLFSMLIKSLWWWVLIAFFLASIYWSYEPGITLRRSIAFITLVVAGFCVAAHFNAESLMYFIAKTIFVAAVMGLIYLVISPSNALGGHGEGERANMFIGIMGDKNGGARLYAYGILILVGLGNYRTRNHKIMLAVLGICLVFANSATAIVMVFAGVGLITLFKVMRTNSPNVNLRRVVIITLLLAAAAVAVSFLYTFLLELLGRDPTLTNRTVIWGLLDEYIQAESTLGYGFGAFWVSDAVASFVARWSYIGNAHSGYYEVLLYGGYTGLVLVIILTLKIIKDLVQGYIISKNSELLAALLAIVLLQCVVNYIGFVVINHNSPDMLIYSVISFIAMLSISAKAPVNREQKPNLRIDQI